jgi:hypothetical protein
LQQPVGQVPASQPVHAWAMHAPEHEAQLAPPVPHAPASVPLWQMPFESQQPFGHEVASHTQLPLTQWVPAEHWLLLPHLQTPLVEPQWSDAPASQLVHTVPLSPQLPGQFWEVMHWLPWQQPVGQLVALHWHTPALQNCPEPQAAPAPHLHTPPAAQLLARVALQGAQTAPPVVQWFRSNVVVQVAPAQQPVGHEVGSQTQTPPTHSCPFAHGAPLLPQLHAPLRH